MNSIHFRAALVLLAFAILGGCSYRAVPVAANPDREVRLLFSPSRTVVLHGLERGDPLILTNVANMDVRIVDASADSILVEVRRAHHHPDGSQRFANGTTATLHVGGIEAQAEELSGTGTVLLFLAGILALGLLVSATRPEPPPPPPTEKTK